MTELARFRVSLTGWEGAPGLNTIYMSPGTLIGGWDGDSTSAVGDDITSAYADRAGNFIDGVVIQVEPDVAIIDDATGALVNVVTMNDPPSNVTGSATGNAIARGAAICLSLLTDNFDAGKRLQGRLFLGPISSGVFDEGSIYGPTRTDFNDAFGSFLMPLTGARGAVWHRPSHGASDGYYGDIAGVVARARPSYLRSRVD